MGRLELVDDIEVRLYTKEKTEWIFRVVKTQFKEPRDTTRPSNKGRVKRVENDIYFITNDFSLTPQEVAEAYRRRWDIKVFFRFLKQELNFSHFLSVSEKGIKIVLYMTLITAMLIMIYKRENELGYDTAKFCFRTKMNDWVILWPSSSAAAMSNPSHHATTSELNMLHLSTARDGKSERTGDTRHFQQCQLAGLATLVRQPQASFHQ